MQDDMWEVAVLRPTKNVALAKTGDNSVRQITTELTLVCKNEKPAELLLITQSNKVAKWGGKKPPHYL